MAAAWAGGTAAGRAQVAQADDSSPRHHLQDLLSFEAEPQGSLPGGWRGDPKETISVDSESPHSGRQAVRLERRADSARAFSTLSDSIPMDFAGETIELRGFLRTDSVSGFAGLLMREDGDSPSLAFDNMQEQALSGTHDWAEYSIRLPLHPAAKTLFFGVLIAGTGTVWVDDLQLLVDGKPIGEAPSREIPRTVLDEDHQFDKGSGVALSALSRTQVRSLTTLGKVWGFLKYHHPAVTSGKGHWDFDLLRVLPEVLAARSVGEANAVMARWVARLGTVAACDPCASLASIDLQMAPRLDWLSDTRRLGPPLSRALLDIYRGRAVGPQFYVSLQPDIQNAAFDHELGYGNVNLPDAGFQLLALYRFWNIIEYWFPYRDVMDEDWDAVLAQSIPRFALAASREAYERELMSLIARAHDSHANLWNALDARPPVGECRLPVSVRFLGDDAVVSELTAEPAKAAGLRLGDVVTAIDGVPLRKRIAAWAPYYGASNEAALRRDIARSMTRGACGPTEVRIRRGSERLRVQATRLASTGRSFEGYRHDLPGETFRRLSERVAYLKLSAVKAAETPEYIERARGAEGLIIDIRNYPSEFVVYALGSLLVASDTGFSRLTHPDTSNPGAFYWGATASLSPEQPHYPGRVVILVDETSMSQAEFTSMALRAAPGSVVVGSTTTGADGDVSPFTLPGGLQTMISGLGVYYPDGTPTQRVGIVPDIFVTPTIAGIRDGRDEVLETALRQILGSDPTAAELATLYRP
ncbi:MAG TPA: S41 family peptidase [Candidatus Polarisedimenticolia bacterium]|nr:S41 family peptidase [Candidatus Polarisedimenticolia bacterium]